MSAGSVFASWAAVLMMLATLAAEPPAWKGGGGPGRKDGAGDADRNLFHYLIDHRDTIHRTVTEIPDGVVAVTESDDPAVAAQIRRHVRSMYSRMKGGQPLRLRDPLFNEFFGNADKIDATITDTDKGVQVRETSADPYAVKLIRAHAGVVSKLLQEGYPEMHRNHPVPPRD